MNLYTSMRDELDEDLFMYIACQVNAEDAIIAEQAFAELHRRYISSLYARCMVFCQKLPDGLTLAEELAATTLTRAFERADQYRPAPSQDKSPERKRTLSWLCTIARNLLRDWLRNPNRPGPLNNSDLDVDASIYSSEDYAAFFNDHETPLSTNEEYRTVADAFERLDSRTQQILLATCLQRDRSPKKTHMLRGSAKLLADHLGTSTDNIRRLRRKGIQQINTTLQKHKQSGEKK